MKFSSGAYKKYANDGYGDFKSEWKDSDDEEEHQSRLRGEIPKNEEDFVNNNFQDSIENQGPEVSKDSMKMWLENTADFYHYVWKNCSGWQGVEAFIDTSPKVKELIEGLRKKFEQELKNYYELDSLTISPEEFTDAAKEAAMGFYQDSMPSNMGPKDVLDQAPSVSDLNQMFKMERKLEAQECGCDESPCTCNTMSGGGSNPDWANKKFNKKRKKLKKKSTLDLFEDKQ